MFLVVPVALLSGCRNRKHSQLADVVYSRMRKHFPEEKSSLTAAIVLLANTAASSGDMDRALNVRDHLNRPDMKKTVGLSWSSVDDKFYVSETEVIDQ